MAGNEADERLPNSAEVHWAGLYLHAPYLLSTVQSGNFCRSSHEIAGSRTLYEGNIYAVQQDTQCCLNE